MNPIGNYQNLVYTQQITEKCFLCVLRKILERKIHTEAQSEFVFDIKVSVTTHFYCSGNIRYFRIRLTLYFIDLYIGRVFPYSDFSALISICILHFRFLCNYYIVDL